MPIQQLRTLTINNYNLTLNAGLKTNMVAKGRIQDF